jgi:hypothetical protein
VVIIFRVDLSVLFNIFTNHSKAIRICTSICFGIALIALGLSTCSTSEVSKTYKKYNKLVKAKKNLAPDPKFNWWALYFFTFFYVAVWHSPNSVDKYYCQNLNGRNANAKSQIHS